MPGKKKSKNNNNKNNLMQKKTFPPQSIPQVADSKKTAH